MRRGAIAIGLLLNALAGVAAAQSPAPTVELAIEVAPGPVEVPLGGTHAVPVLVTVTASGFACAGESALAVAIDVSDATSPLAGVGAHAMPEALNFTIAPGAYASGLAAGPGAFTATGESRLMIMVSGDALGEHDHAFRVRAAYAGGTPDGCRSASPLPAAEATADHAIRTGPAPTPPPALDATGSPPAVDGPAPEPERDTPAPTLAVALVALAAVALHARRR